MSDDEKCIPYNNVQRKHIWKFVDKCAKSMAKANLHPEKVIFSLVGLQKNNLF